MAEDEKHSGLKGALDKAQDLVGGMVGMASAATAGSHSTAAFVTNAAMGDLYEIEAGRIAARRATSETVREMGLMMVEHHTTSMHQMRSALRSSEVTATNPDLQPPMELDNRRTGMLQHLIDAPDDDFDKRYLDQQRLAHQETLTLLKGYVDNGDNPQLRSVAMGAVPMVERHLRMFGKMTAH